MKKVRRILVFMLTFVSLTTFGQSYSHFKSVQKFEQKIEKEAQDAGYYGVSIKAAVAVASPEIAFNAQFEQEVKSRLVKSSVVVAKFIESMDLNPSFGNFHMQTQWVQKTKEYAGIYGDFEIPGGDVSLSTVDCIDIANDDFLAIQWVCLFVAEMRIKHADVIADMSKAEEIAFIGNLYNLGHDKDAEFAQRYSAIFGHEDAQYSYGVIVAKYFIGDWGSQDEENESPAASSTEDCLAVRQSPLIAGGMEIDIFQGSLQDPSGLWPESHAYISPYQGYFPWGDKPHRSFVVFPDSLAISGLSGACSNVDTTIISWNQTCVEFYGLVYDADVNPLTGSYLMHLWFPVDALQSVVYGGVDVVPSLIEGGFMYFEIMVLQGGLTLEINSQANGCPGHWFQVSLMPLAKINRETIDCQEIELDAQPLNMYGPFTYLWNNGATTPSIAVINNSSGYGEYSVTITDVAGTTAEQATFVNQNAWPHVYSVVHDEGSVLDPCINDPSGYIQVTSIFGNQVEYIVEIRQGIYTMYEDTVDWQGTPPIALQGGNYWMIVTDLFGCVFNSTLITIDEYPFDIIESNPQITHTLCDLDGGSVNLYPTGGTAPYTYEWSNGATTSTVSGLVAGTYSVTVIDSGGCYRDEQSIEIDGPITPLSVVVTNSFLCFGDTTTGWLYHQTIGGTAPHYFEWGTQHGNMSVGDYYSITVTDANGCVAIAEGFIEQSSFDVSLDIDYLCDNEAAIITVNFEGEDPNEDHYFQMGDFEYLGNADSVSFQSTSGGWYSFQEDGCSNFALQVLDFPQNIQEQDTVYSEIYPDTTLVGFGPLMDTIVLSSLNIEGCQTVDSLLIRSHNLYFVDAYGIYDITVSDINVSCSDTTVVGIYQDTLSIGSELISVIDTTYSVSTYTTPQIYFEVLEIDTTGIVDTASIIGNSQFEIQYGSITDCILTDTTEFWQIDTIEYGSLISTNETLYSIGDACQDTVVLFVEPVSDYVTGEIETELFLASIETGEQELNPISVSVDETENGIEAIGVWVTPTTYAWNTGDTTRIIGPQVDGTYVVTVTDGNGCIASDSITISTTAVGDIKIENGVSVFPNPTSGILNIETQESISGVRIYDIAGKLLLSEMGRVEKINFESFSKGAYILEITFEGKRSMFEKVVKQ